MRRLVPAALLALLGAACGGRQHTGALAPQTPNEALARFMDAVKNNDLTRMGNLWGTVKGPASGYMDRDRLKRQLQTIHVYWDHKGYRIIEGPTPSQPLNPNFKDVPSPDRLRDFRVELQRPNGCVAVVPMTLVRTDQGGWLVYDVHLESAGNPAMQCQATGGGSAGTRP